jgi:hypothetical protein
MLKMMKGVLLLLSLYASINVSGMSISCSEVSPCYVFQTAPMKYVEPLVYTEPIQQEPSMESIQQGPVDEQFVTDPKPSKVKKEKQKDKPVKESKEKPVKESKEKPFKESKEKPVKESKEKYQNKSK